ncbi:Holliday junction resolvase RecU [Clostridiales bacterium COT073_COT-073]|nr:Holliday junction resolvase RecU [Clostridiales bacterium COT073_COT-073]
MGFWSSRGLRGDAFEELINLANEKYRAAGIALVQKIPTPIKPVELDSERGNIKKAYFEKRSTVDYIGVVQGIPICFDAKNIQKEVLPLSNIHSHQLDFMEDFERQEGISFFLVRFEMADEIYLLPYAYVRKVVAESQNGGRKSIPLEKIRENGFAVEIKQGYFVHYLEAFNQYLGERAKIKGL